MLGDILCNVIPTISDSTEAPGKNSPPNPSFPQDWGIITIIFIFIKIQVRINSDKYSFKDRYFLSIRSQKL